MATEPIPGRGWAISVQTDAGVRIGNFAEPSEFDLRYRCKHLKSPLGATCVAIVPQEMWERIQKELKEARKRSN